MKTPEHHSLLEIAKLLRQTAEEMIESGDSSKFKCSLNLGGACADVSSAFMEITNGQASLVTGLWVDGGRKIEMIANAANLVDNYDRAYVEVGDVIIMGWNHCWTMVGSEVWDLTATQFRAGGCSDIPNVMICDGASFHYVEHQGDEAKSKVNSWADLEWRSRLISITRSKL